MAVIFLITFNSNTQLVNVCAYEYDGVASQICNKLVSNPTVQDGNRRRSASERLAGYVGVKGKNNFETSAKVNGHIDNNKK